MPRVSPAQTSFNAGELTPLLDGRVDMAKYGNGCSRMLNFLALPQGPARRRSGTRFVNEVKDSTDRCWLVEFVFSETAAFVLEFGDEYIRFYTQNGQLLAPAAAAYDGATAYTVGDLVSSAGVTYYCIAATTGNAPPNATYWYALPSAAYEIPSPYSAADLTNANGTFRLSYSQTGDTIFIAHSDYPTKKLQRVTNTRWTISDAAFTGGPFIGTDPDETVTVYSSAATGSVTLTASASIFTAEKVGTLFLLEQKAIDGYKAWEVGKTIVLNDERRSDSNVYKALNAATTGSVKPTHREGAKFDGDNGVQWEYLHSGYGIVRIDSVSGTTAGATVILQIPSQAVGSGNASTRWSFSAWDSVQGYPGHVGFFRQRLVLARDNRLWFSVVADFENFANRDGAETLPDSSISIEIDSGQINETVWIAPADKLLIGTKGAEFAVGEISISDVFGPANVQASQQSAIGSRQVRPARVGDSVMFAQPSGRRIREFRFSFNTDGYEATDMNVLADHVLAGQVTQMSYAQEPHSIIWTACADGSLVAFTFVLEQNVIAFCPQDVGGGIVESVAVIPAPRGDYDQLWMIVRRTIDGVEKRYVEYLMPDWRASEGDELPDAVFSDCSAEYDGVVTGGSLTITATNWASGDVGTIAVSGFSLEAADDGEYIIVTLGDDEVYLEVQDYAAGAVQFLTAVPVSMRAVALTDIKRARSTIGGLSYLEGREVSVLVNGAASPNVTVSGGQISIQNKGSKVQVGLPCPAELETMRIEAGAADGTAQGKIKRIHRVIFRVYETLGGRVGEGAEEEYLNYRNSASRMNQPPGLLSGDYFVSWSRGYETDGRVKITADQPLPMTLVAIYPQMVVEDSR